MIDENILEAILESREARRDKQLALLKEYKTSLISFTLNIPGQIKDNKLYRNIHKEGLWAIIKVLEEERIKITHKEERFKSTGPEGYLAVSIDALELKKIMVNIEENHPLGRVFDLDVFDPNGIQISRRDLGLNPRKCLICEYDARICMRMRSHRYEELIQRIEDIWKGYICGV